MLPRPTLGLTLLKMNYAYRALLIAAVATGIVSGMVDLALPNLLPEGLRKAQEAQDALVASGSILTMVLIFVLSLSFLSIFVLATYGLYRFRSWAPRLALVATALGFLFAVFLGGYAQSGLALALGYLSSNLWGAVLLLSFVPPFSLNFRRHDG